MRRARSAGGRPFAGDHYEITGGCLDRLDAAAAARVGPLLAAADPWRRLGFTAAEMTRYLVRDDAGLDRFLVSVDGAPAGALCLRFPWLRGAYIELVGLAPAARGGGVGAAIIAWMTAEIAGRAGNLWATVSAFNAGARRFYAAHGFVEVATLPESGAPGRGRYPRPQAPPLTPSAGSIEKGRPVAEAPPLRVPIDGRSG